MSEPLEAILETALYAADLDAAEAFYGGVLGLEKVSRQGNRHLFYRCGPGILLIFNPTETTAGGSRRPSGSSPRRNRPRPYVLSCPWRGDGPDR